MRTIGCVGCGNMGSALLRGWASKADKSQWRLICRDNDAAKMDALKPLGVEPAKDLGDLCAQSDVLVLAVKPAQMAALLDEIGSRLKPDAVVISVAAGFNLQRIRLALGLKNALARCMPTITAAVDRGVFALSFDPVNYTEKVKEEVCSLVGLLGKYLVLTESHLDNFAAYMGAGPAYVFAVMQGLAQAGLTIGFPQETNRELLIELFAGCAALAQKDGKSFTQLRDDVCSPGGLTIAGVNVLDRAGLSGILVDCVLAAARRAREMYESK